MVYAAYCVIQAGMLIATVIVPYPESGIMCLAVATIGTAAFVNAVARRRSPRLLGWRLLAVNALGALAIGYVVSISNNLRPTAMISSPLLASLGAVAFLFLAVGLAIVGRRPEARANTADRVDAMMTSAGMVLVAWLFVTEPIGLTVNLWDVTSTALYALGIFFTFAGIVKVMLSYGPRPVALVLVLLAAAALLAATMGILLPAIHTGTLTADRTEHVLWAAHGGLLGAAALHRSFNWTGLHPSPPETDLSRRRTLLFTAIAIVIPTALAIDLVSRPTSFDRTLIGVAVPTVAAAGLLLLLVRRLAVIARVSQQRARALKSRSEALSALVAKQEALRQQLSDRALHDPLTGLYNRVVLAERLDRVLDKQADGPGHSLLLMDLDGFKDVNDTFGHPVGDRVLVDASRRLLETSPDGSVVVRLGGDEFAVLLENTSQAQARVIAEELLEAIRRPFSIDGQEVFLSASIGLINTHEHREVIAPFGTLRDADLALYAAKRAGKNRLAVFDPQLRAERMKRATLAAGLRRALAQGGELHVHYQPIINLATGDIAAVEALARWTTPDGVRIPPDVFIPVAEETGLIDMIGERILRQACHDTSRWRRARPISVSVNASVHQLDDPRFADMVIDALAAAELPGDALILELTESILAPTAPEHPEFDHLKRLREHGIHIAVDDFGTGYSSLAYIARLPVDMVKLDKSFIRERHEPDEAMPDWTFTGAILEAIASLGLQAIAEGVETVEQADALRAKGCPLAQGFLFARPAPVPAIDDALGVRADQH